MILEQIKEAVKELRYAGEGNEAVEVFWDDKTNSPWDQEKHGAWCGSLFYPKDLRKWIKNNPPDGREFTLYRGGEFVNLKY